MPERSCAERVASEWQDRRDDLLFFMRHGPDARLEDGNGSDFNEYALGFDFVEADTFADQEEPYFRYQISWGGPSDELRFIVESHRVYFKVTRIEYWFLDWFDGASLDVTDDEVAQWLAEFLGLDIQ